MLLPGDDPRQGREPEPGARLAAAVLALAVADLVAGTAAQRRRAAAWLFEADESVTFWCARLNVSLDGFRARLRAKLALRLEPVAERSGRQDVRQLEVAERRVFGAECADEDGPAAPDVRHASGDHREALRLTMLARGPTTGYPSAAVRTAPLAGRTRALG